MLTTYLPTYLPTYLFTHPPTYLSSHSPAFLAFATYLPTYLFPIPCFLQPTYLLLLIPYFLCPIYCLLQPNYFLFFIYYVLQLTYLLPTIIQLPYYLNCNLVQWYEIKCEIKDFKKLETFSWCIVKDLVNHCEGEGFNS
jgi:hypothetical protein